MDKIHFAPPKKQWGTIDCWYLQGNHHSQGFLGGAKWISSIHSMLKRRQAKQSVWQLASTCCERRKEATLQKPEDPNPADRDDHVTPLFNASANGHLEVVQCLLDADADKEKADNQGFTPLHIAAGHGHQAVVQCLLDAGADKETADKDGATPLHVAAMQGHQAVVQCFLDASAGKETADKDGATPLHAAAMQGHQAVVQCLLDAGADKETADKPWRQSDGICDRCCCCCC